MSLVLIAKILTSVDLDAAAVARGTSAGGADRRQPVQTTQGLCRLSPGAAASRQFVPPLAGLCGLSPGCAVVGMPTA